MGQTLSEPVVDKVRLLTVAPQPRTALCHALLRRAALQSASRARELPLPLALLLACTERAD